VSITTGLFPIATQKYLSLEGKANLFFLHQKILEITQLFFLNKDRKTRSDVDSK
jgi:hypothetical protein